MNLTNKNGRVLVRRNFDRLIVKVFTNHLVVYVIEVMEITLNLFIIFFHEEILSVKKAPNANQATLTPLEV